MIAGLSKAQALIAGAVAAVVVIGGGSALALRGNGKDTTTAAPASSAPTTSSAAATPTPTPTPTPTAKPTAPPPVNPLTGIGKPPAGPVLAVKIDDTANGRPSRGLDKADIVYIEQAEGGLTRLVAVFGTHKPVVEPVRSVRASDAGAAQPVRLDRAGRLRRRRRLAVDAGPLAGQGRDQRPGRAGLLPGRQPAGALQPAVRPRPGGGGGAHRRLPLRSASAGPRPTRGSRPPRRRTGCAPWWAAPR